MFGVLLTEVQYVVLGLHIVCFQVCVTTLLIFIQILPPVLSTATLSRQIDLFLEQELLLQMLVLADLLSELLQIS